MKCALFLISIRVRPRIYTSQTIVIFWTRTWIRTVTEDSNSNVSLYSTAYTLIELRFTYLYIFIEYTKNKMD